MRFWSVIGIPIVALVLSGCGGGSSSPLQPRATAEGGASNTPSPQSTSVPTTPTPTVELPQPIIEIAWFYSDPPSESPFFRFLAIIRNSSGRTLEDAKVHWEATDDSGALVGSFSGSKSLPPIGAGEEFYYVGGAGALNLSGRPAKVVLKVDAPGRLTDREVRHWDVEVTGHKAGFSAGVWEVSALITAGPETVKTRSITLALILRDSAGTIICADFDTPTNLPESLEPHTKFRTNTTYIKCTGTPETVEVFAAVWPE